MKKLVSFLVCLFLSAMLPNMALAQYVPPPPGWVLIGSTTVGSPVASVISTSSDIPKYKELMISIQGLYCSSSLSLRVTYGDTGAANLIQFGTYSCNTSSNPFYGTSIASISNLDGGMINGAFENKANMSCSGSICYDTTNNFPPFSYIIPGGIKSMVVSTVTGTIDGGTVYFYGRN